MNRQYNSMAFTPEEVKAGLFQKFLNTLIHYNTNSEQHYCDIHITTDGYCTILEWENVPYNHEWGGSFQYVGFDEVVMHEVQLPDGHYALSRNEEEDVEIINDFLNEHSNYGYDWGKHEFFDKTEK